MSFRDELRAFFAGVPLEQRSAEELKGMLQRIADNAEAADDEAMTEYEQRTADITAEIESRAAALASGIEQRRAAVRAAVEGGMSRSIAIPAETTEPRAYDASSPEYRTAWLRNIAVDRDGRHLFGEMTVEERAAFTMTTANTGEVVPTEIHNEIIDLVEADFPLLADAYPTHFTRGFGIPRRTAINAGDAASTAEGAANPDDEENAFDLFPLDGEEIKKHVKMTRKMEIQSIDAFKDWLVKELADRMRVAMEKIVYKRLDAPETGMAADNILTGSLTDDEVRKVFGKLKGKGARCVYASNATIWNVIAGLHEKDGTKLFVPNSMEDPITQGRVYGAAVKKDDNIPDNVIYFGFPKELNVNYFEDVNIMPDIDVKTRVRIWAAYALFDAGLRKPLAFAKYTHSAQVVGG